MRNILSFQRAAQLTVVVFTIFILIHLAVIVGILAFDYVPLDYLWGGQMETREQLLQFELLSVAILGLCVIVVLIRWGRIRMPSLQAASRWVLWVLFALFVLNTVGNLLATTNFEKALGIITGLLALLCLRMALEPLTNSRTGES